MNDITYDYVWEQSIRPNIKILLDKVGNKDIEQFQVTIPNCFLQALFA